MVVFTVTKFSSGAWFIVLLIPTLVFGFFQIHYHYRNVAKILSGVGKRPKHYNGPVMSIILVEDVHAGTLRLVNYAESLGVPWKAIHIELNPEKSEKVQQKWHERIESELGPRDLIMVPSPYRQLISPIHEFVEQELVENPESFINVILGHLVMPTPWEQVLHQNSAYIFNLALQNLERVAVINVPYQIHGLTDGNGHGHGHTHPDGLHETHGVESIGATK
jgi:hypothetical protein